MINRRTFIIVLMVIFVIDMIQAGVIDDIGEAIHYEGIKKFTQDAAKKTGEAATKAFQSVKKFFTENSPSTSEIPSAATITKSTS